MSGFLAKPRKVMVTGGAGFLGSHLCDALMRAGHEVLCVDNMFTGSKSNIQHLLANPRFEFMRHDVTFPLYVDDGSDVLMPAADVRSPLSSCRWG